MASSRSFAIGPAAKLRLSTPAMHRADAQCCALSSQPAWALLGVGGARQPQPVSRGARLGAVRDAELGQYVRDVGARRLGGDEQLLADLAVGPPLGDQPKDLE